MLYYTERACAFRGFERFFLVNKWKQCVEMHLLLLAGQTESLKHFPNKFQSHLFG